VAYDRRTGVLRRLFGVRIATADVFGRREEEGCAHGRIEGRITPFGYSDPSGKIVGFEPDLAADVAKAPWRETRADAGRGIESDSEFLQQGKIDLMIATMSDTPERRKTVDIVDPDYYASGTNVMAKKSENLKSWDQLKGKKVCLIQGAFYNKELQESTASKGVAFPGTAEAYFGAA